MFYEIKMREQYLEAEKRGEIRGKIEGEEVTARLYVKLIEDGRYEDAKKAESDPEFRLQLFEEYGLLKNQTVES